MKQYKHSQNQYEIRNVYINLEQSSNKVNRIKTEKILNATNFNVLLENVERWRKTIEFQKMIIKFKNLML